MQGTYNHWLVALSLGVAMLVSFTALSLAARVAAVGERPARYWLLSGSVVMGIGIWSMHFIGMVALELPISLRYDVPLTLVSLGIAIVTSGMAIWTAAGLRLGTRRLVGGAIAMGSGISAMHYCGMNAIQIVPAISYDPLTVFASVSIAGGASFAALWLAFRLRTGHSWKLLLTRLLAAAVMGVAIGGMHYTGMAAAHFARGAYCIGGRPIDHEWLAMVIGLIAVSLLAIVSITAVFDAHLRSHTAAQEARSRASEERLRQISDNIPALIAYWDSAGICRFANRAYCEKFAVAAADLTGVSMDALFGRDPARRARMSAALAGTRQFFDWSDLDAAGIVRHWQCEYLPHVRNGRIEGVYALDVDITERKNAERRMALQEARLAAASRMGEIGGWELDRDAATPWWSDMTYRIHDLPIGDLASLGAALDHYPPHAREHVKAAIAGAFETGKPFDEIWPFVTASGRHRWVRSIGQPQLIEGRYARIVGAFQDVTAMREGEETLRRAKEAAEAAQHAQSDFLANMSHEIRTPLNGVIGMTGLLLETTLSMQQREYVDIVRSSGECLLALINHILDFSKIEAGRMELESILFDTQSVIEDTVDAVALPAAQKGLELMVDIGTDVPRQLRGDPMRLRQILLNLLSNAIKFTERGDVTLTASLRPRTPAGPVSAGALVDLEFAVIDTGMGIGKDRIDHLFDPFVQADSSTTRKFGGTGLGLSISKRLAEAMGGGIDVDSELGQGSTFRLRMSLERAEAPAASPVPQLAGARILVVARHPGSRCILERQLVPHGCELVLADCAERGLALYQAALAADTPPSAVVVERELDDHPGLWLVASIRECAAPPPSFVMLTSLASPLDEADAARVDRVIAKPTKTAGLVRSLATLLEHGRRSAASGQDRKTDPGLEGLRVLLVEDHPVNQKLAWRLLERLGIRVEVANNGIEALAALGEGDFDAVLMDCQMPVMDGYEATRRLRRGEGSVRNPRIPVIALTAHALSSDRALCLAAGMNDYLTKPINPMELQQALMKIAPPGERRARRHPCEGFALFDQQALLMRTGGDEGFARELVELFVRSARETAAQICAAIEQGLEAETIRRLAHHLKGSAAAASAKRIAACAAELERSAASEEALSAFEHLRGAFNRTIAEWQAIGWLALPAPLQARVENA